MIHKTLEEWFDTMPYVAGIAGLMLFFFLYWSNAYQVRYAEVVMQDFLYETAIAGKIRQEEYEILQNRLTSVCPDTELKIMCYKYRMSPMYAIIPAEEWRREFLKNNTRNEIIFKKYEPKVIQEKAENLRYQTETNESLLAGDRGEYLPLPSENGEISVCAVRANQEIYEDESLITLCRITTSQDVFYKEALPSVAKESGEILLELELDEKVYPVPVTVVCHPRILLCKYGHSVVNTKFVLEETKKTGNFVCPYCHLIPKTISCDVSGLKIKAGEQLTSISLGITVLFLDGHTEYITPDSEDWQDDFDMNYCGTQTVTIRFRNKEIMITIVTENPVCRNCGEQCNDRCPDDYEKNPYCTACLSEMYVDTGKWKGEEQIVLGKELVDCLNSNGEILLERGDFVVLAVEFKGNVISLQQEIKIDGKSGEGS